MLSSASDTSPVYAIVKVKTPTQNTEILMARLLAVGFEAFEEHSYGFDAYIENSLLKDSSYEDILSEVEQVSFTLETLPQQNWNKTWEAQFRTRGCGDLSGAGCVS